MDDHRPPASLEADARLDQLEQRAAEEVRQAEAAMEEAGGALREFYTALKETRQAMRARGFPLVNELGRRRD